MRQGNASASALSARGPESVSREMVPTIVFHGDRDSKVHPENGDRVIAHSMVTTAMLSERSELGQAPGGLSYTRSTHTDARGRTLLEQWVVHGLGHAWSGGSPAGSYTDPRGPDAAREMMRFFLAHAHPGTAAPQGAKLTSPSGALPAGAARILDAAPAQPCFSQSAPRLRRFPLNRTQALASLRPQNRRRWSVPGPLPARRARAWMWIRSRRGRLPALHPA